nr:SNARE-interacting protein KEULE-like [Ipomoea batatas]
MPYSSLLQDVTRENKLRLLMIYAAVHPEKFEDDKLAKLMELARLPQDDMNAVYNMRRSMVQEKKRNDEESTWQLSRFSP